VIRDKEYTIVKQIIRSLLYHQRTLTKPVILNQTDNLRWQAEKTAAEEETEPMMKDMKSATTKRKKVLSKKDNPPKNTDEATIITETLKVGESDVSPAPVFPIVGIGASAGGLEALELFFGNMPQNNGMAFVVIQHLDPNHVGMMPELLQRITPMKVFQASDCLKVKPNCVFVIPPNKSLSLLNGSLHLFDPVEARGLRLPIDIFFRSLAADRQENSIGIILSGMGSDGSLGLKAIREKNGVVLVQDPATAKFDSMPRSATEAVIADIVAPVEELPAKLIAFLKFAPIVQTEPDIDNKLTFQSGKQIWKIPVTKPMPQFFAKKQKIR
jgi:two-component system CheB/CheR fusion protein